MTNIPLHRSVLLRLLKDFYQDPVLAAQLGFTGGTCLHFLHSLPRFSTDLDFALIPTKGTFNVERMDELIQQSIDIRDRKEKNFTWFWLGTYKDAPWNVKIEVSKRMFPHTFSVLDLYGLSVRTMDLPSMLAHKLCAITDRPTLANRDIFDVHFLLSQHVAINDDIIKERMNTGVEEYVKKLIVFIPKNISKRGILDGLGELLDEQQKQWVRDQLIKDLLFHLHAYADSAR